MELCEGQSQPFPDLHRVPAFHRVATMPKAWAVAVLMTAILGGCGGPTAALEAQLAKGTPVERAAAARSLAEMGSKAAPDSS